MKRKFIGMALAFSFCFLSCAFAEESIINVSHPDNDTKILVSGNVLKPAKVSLMSVYLGEDAISENDAQSIALENSKNPDNVDYYNIIRADNDGGYTFSYKTDGKSGWYLFTVATDRGIKEQKLFQYFSPDYADEMISKLNEYIKASDFEKILEFIDKYEEPLMLSNDYIDKMKGEVYFEEIAEILTDCGEVSDRKEFLENLALSTARLYLKNTPEVVKDSEELTEIETMLLYFEEFGLTDDKLFCEVLKDASSEVRIKILNAIRGFDENNVEDFVKKINEEIILTTVNNSGWGKIQSAIEKGIHIFEEDTKKEFLKLSDIKKAKVAKEIAEKADASTYITTDELDSDIKESIKNQKSSNSSEGGSSGGKGGSGSSSVNSYTSVAMPSVKEDNIKKVKTFDDLTQAEWARQAVEALAKDGIITGRTENEFYPNAPITREEFTAIIVRAFCLENNEAKSSFTDVSENAWYYTVVSSAYAKGIVNGKDDGSFGSGEFITREDLATIAYRAARLSKYEFADSEISFNDKNEISEYAKEAIGQMCGANIINGVGNNMFAPKSMATRAQAAKIVYGIIAG